MSRKKARSWTMKALYEMEIKDTTDPSFPDKFTGYHDLEDDEEEFLKDILRRYIEQKDEIDAIIDKHIRHRELDHLNRLDLVILRLAVTEIINKTTPVSVAINEAVELAKKYSAEGSYRFVNGVLASVAREEE